MDPIHKWAEQFARAAALHGLLALPPDFSSWEPDRRAGWSALEVCRLKHAADRGDQETARFFRLRAKWASPPSPLLDAEFHPVDRDLIMILGLHGSLSSCLALCLKRLGVWLGRDHAGGEDKPLAELCERIMPFPRSEFLPDDEAIRAMLRNWLAGYFAAAPPAGAIAVKYPTLIAMADKLVNLQPRVRLVVMGRPLEESIQSRLARNERTRTGWADWQIEQVQTRLCGVLRAFLDGRSHYRVEASALVTEPVRTLAGLVKWLGLSVTGEALEEAALTVDRSKAENIGKRPPPRRVLSGDWCRDTTVAVTGFERPRCLETFLRTCHNYFPTAEILVADSSERPLVSADPRVRVLPMPYDAGLSAGRNRLFDEITTPYVLLGDDDLVFTDDSNVDLLRKYLEAHDFDMVAGTVLRMRTGEVDGFYGHFEERDGILAALPGPAPGTNPPRFHLAVNFYLAKVDRLREIRYRDDLKVGEHVEFFLRAWRAGLRIGCVPLVMVVDQENARESYGGFRTRAGAMNNAALAGWAAQEGYREISLDFVPGIRRSIKATGPSGWST